MVFYRCNSNYCSRGNYNNKGFYGKNTMTNGYPQRSELPETLKLECDNGSSTGHQEQNRTGMSCLKSVAAGGFTLAAPFEKGEEYQLVVLNLDMPNCKKHMTEISFACNLTAIGAVLDVSVQIYKLWDCRQIWLPLASPVRVTRNDVPGISDSICFTVYDCEQIQSRCCSYLAMLRFLSPVEEHGNLTVCNATMTAMMQVEHIIPAGKKGIL